MGRNTTPATGAPHLIITAQMVRATLMCARQVWLEQYGDPALRGALSLQARLLLEQGQQHEITIQQTEAPQLEPLPVASWEEGVRLTRDALSQGVTGLWHGFLEHQAPLDLTDRLFTVRGQPDLLQRVPCFGTLAYRPIEIKRRRTPQHADWVQLDLYTWLLRQVQMETAPGELWLGADEYGRPWQRLPHEYDEERLMEALTATIATLDAPSMPSATLGRHCDFCLWQEACFATRVQAGQVDVLPGVGPALRGELEAARLYTIEDVAACPLEVLQQVRGVGSQRARQLQASARAWVEGRPIWHEALPAAYRRAGWMFDLETCEVNGKTMPWCMGWCDSEGQAQIALLAPGQDPQTLILPDGQSVMLAADVESLWATLADAVAGTDGPIYHWSPYDRSMLNSSAPPDLCEQLAPRFVDLLAVCRRTVSLPLPSLSLKAVAPYLGFPWPGHDDWFLAYQDYQSWLDWGDLEALARACTYQRADVQALAWVWRWLVEHAAHPVFPD
ncbi:MAG: hypothetical protein Kow00106_19570 [Anaerolineae bacterium]